MGWFRSHLRDSANGSARGTDIGDGNVRNGFSLGNTEVRTAETAVCRILGICVVTTLLLMGSSIYMVSGTSLKQCMRLVVLTLELDSTNFEFLWRASLEESSR